MSIHAVAGPGWLVAAHHMPTKTVNARHQRIAWLSKEIARLSGLLSVELSYVTAVERPDVMRVQKAVSTIYHVSVSEINGPLKTNRVAEARQVSMFLCHNFCPLGPEQIAAAHGNRTKGTVLHAFKIVKDRKGTDPKFLDRYIQCFNLLNNEKQP